MKKFINRYNLFFLYSLVYCLTSCKQKINEELFTSLPAEMSGIKFSNDIRDNDSSFSFINEFGYMGGGVGIGDFNNDGKKDIFFTGNQVSCKLYLNQGNNKFEDISLKAGIETNVWCTGVSVVDINQDGYEDIYVCVFGKDLMHRSKNLLFINQHDLTFKEEAAQYGLADLGFSTQAAFLDYDRDGDLDMYLVNYLLSNRNSNTVFPRDRSGFSQANDVLYRNDMDSTRKGHPNFKNVSFAAGIKEDGYGLGVSVSDFNNDGWPDIYVTNDFVSNDELWQNNHDGTFTNVIAKSLQHQSYSSMGVDAADLNNDSLIDIVTLDMLPETNERKKMSFSFLNYERYELERRMGYEPEFMRNMLQLNTGNTFNHNAGIPFFSEIGRLSDIDATDWSWSVLLADFDNDGWKDIHITNGIGRDFINADFLEFSSKAFSETNSKEEQQKIIQQKLSSMKNVNLSNYFYHNNHDLTFSERSAEAGIDEPSMSNGAAYADLDNDGDLDLIVNNINKPAYVFLNNTNKITKILQNHFIKVKLQGDLNNRAAFGSKISLYANNSVQTQEQNPVRGYFSSVDQDLIFGLGSNGHIDSLLVSWPDGKKEMIQKIGDDTTITLSWLNARFPSQEGLQRARYPFEDITESAGYSYLHQDYSFNDYTRQRLLPQKYSQTGPFITTGDINGDGLTDFFIGGANYPGKIFTQRNGISFSSKNLADSLKFEEDTDCKLFDADMDGDLDLLVAGGGMQYEDSSKYYKPRLYVNDGKGNFHLNTNAIPDEVRTISSCISTGDYDGDGDLDLFIGGRVSGNYPVAPRSYLLQNNKGFFTDVTAKTCPALQAPGMVTGAVWTDFNNDKQLDLVLSGEWMPVQFFKGEQGRLIDITPSTGLTNINGLWKSLLATDLDGDGDIDIVAGNLGLNCEYRSSASEPMQLYATDYDGNGSIDPFFFYYIKGDDGTKKLVTGLGRGRLVEQVPLLKKKYLLNADFSHATYSDIFGKIAADKILSYKCDETRSCYFENMGNGKFIKHILPVEAQFSPINSIVCDDFNGDGYKDLLLAGNEYQTDVSTGRYDASYGCLLIGNKDKNFVVIPNRVSGFAVSGDVKDMKLIKMGSQANPIIIVGVNNDSMRVFKINKSAFESNR